MVPIMKKLITLALLLILSGGCLNKNIEPEIVKEKPICRKYEVHVTNWVSEWYECDTIIEKSPSVILMQNREDTIPFLEIHVTQDTFVEISPKICK